MQHRTIAPQKQERDYRNFTGQTQIPEICASNYSTPGKVIAKNNPLILYIEGKLLFLQTFI